MKTSFLKPGFEFIFSLALIAILGLPPVLLAQNQKDLEIKIENGDTTVNGKNIKDLSASERHDAMKDIHHLTGGPMNFNSDSSAHHFMRMHRDTMKMGFRRRQAPGYRQTMITQDMTIRDSMGNVNTLHIRKRPFMIRKDDEAEDLGMRMRDDGPGRPGMRFERDHRNTQNFNYVSTNNQGFSTHVNFRVSEPEHEDLQKITGVEGSKLEITDLSLVPEFSTGKTLLIFNLPTKAASDVYLKDGNGKVIWNEKYNGTSFSKSFLLPENGIYYLHVKQGGGVNVKKIVKEE